MNTAVLRMKSCAKCPFCDKTSIRTFTGDSWDVAYDWKCEKTDKIVDPWHSWNDPDPKIPDSCPLIENDGA